MALIKSGATLLPSNVIRQQRQFKNLMLTTVSKD